MTTFVKALLTAVEASMATQVAIPSPSIWLERDDPVESSECPALVIALGDARKQAIFGSEGDENILDVQVEVTLSVHTRGAPRTTVADPLVTAVHGALLRDPSLGGLAQRLGFTGLTPRQAQAETLVGITDLTYQARCLVRERDLTLFTH